MSRSEKIYFFDDKAKHEAFENELAGQYLSFTTELMRTRRADVAEAAITSDDLSSVLLSNPPAWVAPFLMSAAHSESGPEAMLTAAVMMTLQARRQQEAASISVSAEELIPLLSERLPVWLRPHLADLSPSELDHFVSAAVMAAIEASHSITQGGEGSAEARQRLDRNYGLVCCYAKFPDEMQRCVPEAYISMVPAQRQKFNLMQSEYDIGRRVEEQRERYANGKAAIAALGRQCEDGVGERARLELQQKLVLDRIQQSVLRLNQPWKEGVRAINWLDPKDVLQALKEVDIKKILRTIQTFNPSAKLEEAKTVKEKVDCEKIAKQWRSDNEHLAELNSAIESIGDVIERSKRSMLQMAVAQNTLISCIARDEANLAQVRQQLDEVRHTIQQDIERLEQERMAADATAASAVNDGVETVEQAPVVAAISSVLNLVVSTSTDSVEWIRQVFVPTAAAAAIVSPAVSPSAVQLEMIDEEAVSPSEAKTPIANFKF